MFLYQLRDSQIAALAPWHLLALAGGVSPGRTGTNRSLTAELAAFAKTANPYLRPSFGFSNISFRGENLDVREEIADLTPFCRLLRFKRFSSNESLSKRAEGDPNVLIVAPFSGHYPTLLKDTVAAMLPSHNVYFTDWTDAKMIPVLFGTFDLEDQITYLMRIFRKLGDNLHVAAFSQASLSALCATALLAEDEKPFAPRTLTLFGGPIDSRQGCSPLSQVAQRHPISWFKETQIQLVPFYYPGAFRPVYPGFMRLQNRMAMFSDRKLSERRHYFNYLAHGCELADDAREVLYDEFLTVMDVPAELYLQFVERAYQRAALAEGAFTWRGRPVRPEAIRHTALLTIEAEIDELSPPGQTRAALDLCASLPADRKKAHLEIGVGHYGIFTGRKWRNNIQPALHAFIRQHSLSAQEMEAVIG